MGRATDAPTLTATVCETTPARRDGGMLPFDVWCEITRDVEGTIRRVVEEGER